MTYTLSIGTEPAEPINLEEWLASCGDGGLEPEDVAAIRAMTPGSTLCFGGGAAPLFTLEAKEEAA